MRLIDADALQKLFNEISTGLLGKAPFDKDIEHQVRAFLMVSEMIADAPTTDKEESKKVEYNHHCPNCGRGLPAKMLTDEYCSCCFNWKYCPDCGQKLRWE